MPRGRSGGPSAVCHGPDARPAHGIRRARRSCPVRRGRRSRCSSGVPSAASPGPCPWRGRLDRRGTAFHPAPFGGVGYPPTMTINRVIGVDLGGTKILAGLIEDGRVLQTVEQPTPTTSQDALFDGLAAAVRELPLDGVDAVGFGIPSRFDYRTGHALGAVNIPLREVDFIEAMNRRLHLPIGVENDASCAAYAEHAHGAGQGTSYFGTLTLGTGVGGGIIFAGRLLHAWSELGHMVIVADGVPCQGACAGRGHVEAYCSGTAATRVAPGGDRADRDRARSDRAAPPGPRVDRPLSRRRDRITRQHLRARAHGDRRRFRPGCVRAARCPRRAVRCCARCSATVVATCRSSALCSARPRG